ncbi:DNA-binding protein HU (plasmid) [Deferribacter desulfuricans SSM1]|uniref:DNA-binding protein HU n=1 Tax=Deferribacter desulfuricans (strain DSM 14783 / JCM 11476 / NBRC 101012 / SSM1) TaxID=639282 RepID=D3PF56_DEFDS|nr:HU family DNA-binding protein [Deferribacter desulfuricans]BAI81848.1 DNA-binding protein HU [Deferribacter desulfuricans SSM1]
MKKEEIIALLVERTNMRKKDVKELLNAFEEIVLEGVKEGKKVPLGALGYFKKVERSARTGHNPKTGEKIQIPATVVPKFVPGKKFKEAVK